MLGVLLVVVGPIFRLEVWADLLKDSGEDVIDRLLVRPVAVPDGDEVGVEPGGEGDTANIVAWRIISSNPSESDSR